MSDRAITPRGINHLVLNVRDLEVSHKFWTEIIGFRQVAELKNRPFKMRFYSGLSEDGDVSHHDLPRPVWENDIDGAQNFSQRLPTEGPEALVDTTDNPVFGGAKVSA